MVIRDLSARSKERAERERVREATTGMSSSFSTVITVIVDEMFSPSGLLIVVAVSVPSPFFVPSKVTDEESEV